MSNKRKRHLHKVPPTRKAVEMPEQNGPNEVQQVPPDLVWDESDPPTIFACSNHIEHARNCNGLCEATTLDESGVEAANEGRAWARAGMSFLGLPVSLAGVVPVNGINVELYDLLCEHNALLELVLEMAGMTREDFAVRFRQWRTEHMRGIREKVEPQVRRQRAQQSIAVAQKPPLLGPDGQPFH